MLFCMLFSMTILQLFEKMGGISVEVSAQKYNSFVCQH